MERIKILHQCGHNYVWNFQSFNQDRVGDGLILSPTNMPPSKIDSFPLLTRMQCMFDPQFYLPGSEKSKLNQYSFFPNTITDGYSTVSFEERSEECAKQCIDYQIQNNFKYIIIPTFFFDEIPPDYLDRLRTLLILPFINYINNINCDIPVLLSIVLKSLQLEERQEYRDSLLNLLTENPEIAGVYILPFINKSTKRIKNSDYIYNLLSFIDILRLNDLEVHVGYSDIEGLIYSIADVNSITIGAYENLRNFAIRRFDSNDDEQRRNPTPRIYSSILLQWIDFNYINPLRRLYPDLSLIFDNNNYFERIMQNGYNPHFTKPEPYKHYFISYSNQIRSLPETFETRYNYLVSILNHSMEVFRNISNRGIVLGDNDDGSHIPLWLTALNQFFNLKTGV